MNKFINVLLIFVGLPIMLYTIYVGFDLPVGFLNMTGGELPYRFETFLGMGLLFLIINLRRSVRRWMGIRLVNQIQKFKWNSTMSRERITRVNMYNMMEAVIMAFFGIGLYVVSPEAWMPMIGLLFGSVDNLIFSIYGTSKHKFRTGLTSKALVLADRDVIIIYFKGLRKVSAQQQSIYFDFIKDLQLTFPTNCIKTEEQPAFFDALKATVDQDKVYFSTKLATEKTED